MAKFDVAVVQTDSNGIEQRIINAPRTEDGTVLLDFCPAGTMDVYGFESAKDAAKFMGVTPSTVYRQRREMLNDLAEEAEYYS